MNNFRAGKSGIAAETQSKIEANFDPQEAAKCLYWIKLMTDAEEIPGVLEEIDASHDNFHELLGDGVILLKLMDRLCPDHINWNDKMFQKARIEAMQLMRERERIATFTKLAQEYGVTGTYTFPTESLHEKGALNLAQVCTCIRALGVEAQTKPDYEGPEGFWPKKCERNIREFTEEQLNAGKNIISLQYGSNKGASQAGMNMGKPRQIND
ncbi:hypothetical protein HELRODRAFT_97044 [Helobdella robusta]|uniref:Transgelin n=1 Tax=Helobdella robusta TaxID=6412 RepID=T1G9F0_HELRO|nr:hypothetical protein HELRODRAFT_97044 [Helobdella robusta]ESO10819.1 hypothetical protein HELRODRAFT_97044 [Helobdella robusta]